MVQEDRTGWKEFLWGWLTCVTSQGGLPLKHHRLVVSCQIKVHSHVCTITGYYHLKAHPKRTIIKGVLNASMVMSRKL
jgi:hypothetical protein